MKPLFTDQPEAWTRVARHQYDPIRYASAVERFAAKGHDAVLWFCVVGLSVLSVILILGGFQ